MPKVKHAGDTDNFDRYQEEDIRWYGSGTCIVSAPIHPSNTHAHTCTCTYVLLSARTRNEEKFLKIFMTIQWCSCMKVAHIVVPFLSPFFSFLTWSFCLYLHAPSAIRPGQARRYLRRILKMQQQQKKNTGLWLWMSSDTFKSPLLSLVSLVSLVCPVSPASLVSLVSVVCPTAVCELGLRHLLTSSSVLL